MTAFKLVNINWDIKDLTVKVCLLPSLVEIMGQGDFYKCKIKEKKKKLDIISDNASFADALSNVEPHQHLGGYKSISQGIL